MRLAWPLTVAVLVAGAVAVLHRCDSMRDDGPPRDATIPPSEPASEETSVATAQNAASGAPRSEGSGPRARTRTPGEAVRTRPPRGELGVAAERRPVRGRSTASGGNRPDAAIGETSASDEREAIGGAPREGAAGTLAAAPDDVVRWPGARPTPIRRTTVRSGSVVDTAGAPLRWRWVRFTPEPGDGLVVAVLTGQDGTFRVELDADVPYDVDLVLPEPPDRRDTLLRADRVRPSGKRRLALVSPR